ncbi:uncharacterized protein LOC129405960 [Sorex araneus]|uniref:uncharacterized protein LOC129405960 n=1 Tax=Sorex araneus TaxID=42254 RepID=UPI002433A9E0|nr:uncharacterized protein LOC129405960 [Sorex araneus]
MREEARGWRSLIYDWRRRSTSHCEAGNLLTAVQLRGPLRRGAGPRSPRVKLKSHAGSPRRCPAPRATFFRPPLLSEKRTPGAQTLFRSDQLHHTTARKFCSASPAARARVLPRTLAARGNFSAHECRELRWRGMGGGVIWVPKALPTSCISQGCKQVLQTTTADPYVPSPPTPRLSTQLQVLSGDWNLLLLWHKSAPGKEKTALPPPLFKSTLPSFAVLIGCAARVTSRRPELGLCSLRTSARARREPPPARLGPACASPSEVFLRSRRGQPTRTPARPSHPEGADQP